MKSYNLSTFIDNSLIIYILVVSVLIFSNCIMQSASAADGDVVVQYDVYENDEIRKVCVIAEGYPMLFIDSGHVFSSDNNWMIEYAFGNFQNIKTNTVIDYETYAPLANGAKTYTVDVHETAYQITLTVRNKLEVDDQSIHISENASINDVIGLIYVSSYDLADFSPSFYIRGGNTNHAFALSSPSGGTIIVNDGTQLDYENIANYNLTVLVGNGSYTDTANISISVTNVNEPPVVADQIVSINENLAPGAITYEMVATDPDNDSLSYAIVGGNTGNAFSISETTGLIHVAGNLNY